MKIADTSGQDRVIEQHSNSRLWWTISVSGLAVILISIVTMPLFAKWISAEHSVSIDRIRTATVEYGDFVRDVSVQGKVVAAVSPTLYAAADGTISFLVQAGETVAQGALLASIDSPELASELEQQQATLQSMAIDEERQAIQSKKQQLENQKTVDLASVALNAAKREERRAEKAWQKKAISALDYEKAQDEKRNAKLAYEHAVADAKLNSESLAFELKTKRLAVQRQRLLVNELQRQVSELEITSPVNGIVGQLLLEEKNSVTKNQPVMSVVDLSQFEVEVQIPETYADDLTIGMTAEIQSGTSTYQAQIVSISPEIQNNQVIGRVRFSKEIPEDLRQNQRMTTRILMEHKNDVLMVQRGPFLEAGGGRVAYVITDNVAQKKLIETGSRSLSKVELLDGLKLGDKIIISNTESFKGAESVLINQ